MGIRRAAVGIGIGLAGLVLLALVAVLILTSTDWGRDRVRQVALDRLRGAVDGQLEIGRVEGHLLHRVRLVDVTIRDRQGRPFLEADTVATGFGLGGLLGQRIELMDLRIVGADVVLDRPPGEAWNYARIFRLDREPAEPGPPGWGDWMRLDDVSLVDTRVTVRTEWRPPDDLRGPERAAAVRAALARDSREYVVEVPGGYQNVMEFSELDAALPRVLIAHPDTAGVPFEVASLSGLVRPFAPPPARVHDLSGQFRIVRDSLFMSGVQAVLRGSRLSGGGVYALHSGDLRLLATGDPIAFEDLRWIYPPLPERGDGRLVLDLEMRSFENRIRLSGMDVAVGDARLTGRLELTTGDPVRIGETELRFQRVETALVERFLDLELPRPGELTGRLALSGKPDALAVDGDIRFDDAAGATSRILAEGGLATHPDVRFRSLRLRFTPLRTELARVAAPDLPPRGSIEGVALLTGTLERFQLDADLALRDPRHGSSRVRAAGEIDRRAGLRFRGLRVEADPVRVDLLRQWAPDLPLGGTLSGVATLDGSAASAMTVRGDVVHEEAGERSRVIGRAEVVSGPGGRATVDVRLDPLSLDVAGRFVPAAGLHGSVTGRLQAAGDLADLRVNGELGSADGGVIRAVGTLDLESAEPGYDLDVQVRDFDPGAVSRRAPARADLTGTLAARGRGLDPATMRATIAADLTGSGVGGTRAELVRLRLELEDGLARVDSSLLRLDGAEAALDGSFGLVADREGVLAYRVAIDSLHALAPWLPGGDTAVAAAAGTLAGGARAEPSLALDLEGDPQTADDTVAPVTPLDPADRIAAQELADSRHYVADDGARVAETVTRVQTHIERLDREPERTPAALLAAVSDTAGTSGADPSDDTTAVEAASPEPPADSVAGAIRASGTLSGNVTRLDARGYAELEELLYRGTRVGAGSVEYAVADIGTELPDIRLDADLRNVRAGGISFNTISGRGRHSGVREEGSGELLVEARVDERTEYRADVEFDLSLARNEVRLGELMLRLDTVTWAMARPGAIGWAGEGIEVAGIDLVSDAGGRVRLDGRLPIEGGGELEVAIEDLEIAQLAALLQRESRAEGRLDLDARVEGTSASPRMTGTARLENGRLNDDEIPETTASFRYADGELDADVEMRGEDRVLVEATARLPMDLSLTSDSAPRLLPGDIAIDLRADSLPVEAIPQLAAYVQSVRGLVRADVEVRGTFAEPVLAGVVELDLDSARIVPLDVPLEQVAGVLRLDGDAVRVDSLVALSGGPIRVTGEIGIATLTDPTLELEVEARGARIIDTEDVTLVVDGDLTVGGTLAVLDVEGVIRTRRGVIMIPELSEMGATNVVALHAPAGGPRIEQLFLEELRLLERDRPILNRLRMDVELRIDRDVWLRSTEANVEIYTSDEAGPLRIRNAPETGLALEGTLRTDRGEYEFMSRRFDLTRGSATFVGDPDLNPILQIAAEHEVRIPGREAFALRVLLGGTLRDPEITLESTAQPPIAQTDLLYYLAFGRESGSFLHRQGSALSSQGGGAGELVGNVAGLASQQLGTVALDAVASDIEGDVMEALGVDVFRISPAELPPDMFTGGYADLLRSTEVEAGRYISSRLFVAGQLNAGVTRPGIRFEYDTVYGVQWRTSWRSRWLPTEPTLTEQDPRQAGVLSSFLVREWRF